MEVSHTTLNFFNLFKYIKLIVGSHMRKLINTINITIFVLTYKFFHKCSSGMYINTSVCFKTYIWFVFNKKVYITYVDSMGLMNTVFWGFIFYYSQIEQLHINKYNRQVISSNLILRRNILFQILKKIANKYCRFLFLKRVLRYAIPLFCIKAPE